MPVVSKAATSAEETPPRRRERLFRKTGWGALASFANTAGFAAASILCARILGPAGTGEIAYAIWLVTAVVTIASLGLSQSATRYLAELEGAGLAGDADGLSRWFLRRTFYLAAEGGMGLTSIWLATQRNGGALAPVIVLVFAGQVMNASVLASLAGRQRFKSVAKINGLGSIIQIAGVGFGAWSFGVPGALSGYAIGCIAGAVEFLRTAFSGPVIRPDTKLYGRIKRYSLETWLATVISLCVWSRMEVLFLDHYRSKREVGLFTVGLSLAQLATQGPLLLGTALMPHFAQLMGATEFENVKRTYARMTRILAFLVVPLCFSTAAVTPTLLPSLFGDAFAPAVPNAMVLVTAAAVGATATVGSSLQYALERSRFIATTSAVGAVLVVTIYPIVISRWGVSGAAWARASLQIALVAVGMAYTAARMKVPVPINALARIAAAATLAAIPGLCVVTYWRGVPGLVVAVPCMGIGYLIAARCTGALDSEDAAQLSQVAMRLPWRMGTLVRAALCWIAAVPTKSSIVGEMAP